MKKTSLRIASAIVTSSLMFGIFGPAVSADGNDYTESQEINAANGDVTAEYGNITVENGYALTVTSISGHAANATVTGGINNENNRYGLGIYNNVNNTSSSTINVTGDMYSHGYCIYSQLNNNSASTISVNGDLQSQDRTFENQIDGNSQFNLTINGDITSPDNGIQTNCSGSSHADITMTGNSTINGVGGRCLRNYIHDNAEYNATITGNLVSREYAIYDNTADRASHTASIIGDVTSTTMAAIYINNEDQAHSDFLVDGTVTGANPGFTVVCSYDETPSTDISLTVWRIIPRDFEGTPCVVTTNTLNRQRTMTTYPELEAQINYIIRVDQPAAGDVLYVTDANGDPLSQSHGYECAHEGETVYLRSESGFNITRAYNNGVEITPDADGNFCVEVPKGGGVELSVEGEYDTYTVNFVDHDGTLLHDLTVTANNVPTYIWEDPTRPSTETVSYTFAGWTPSLGPVNSDTTYTATYTETYIGSTEPSGGNGSSGETTPSPATEPTTEPTTSPSTEPTEAPSAEPTAEPSAEPTTEPTAAPAGPSSSAEEGVSSFVERLYTISLGRSSDPSGRQDWVDAVTLRGQTGADVARGFLYSPEFLNMEVTNEEFVGILYSTFFDREADAEGLAAWVRVLENGESKEHVIEGFINSTEWANLCLLYGIASGGTGVPSIEVEPNQATIDFATRLYTTCLGRAADENGMMAWARQIANQRETGSGAARGFFFSPEFTNQNVSDEEYINRLYRTFMGREADEAGFTAWVAQLSDGVSREAIFEGFAQSPEFARICASYGIIK
ncbi:MAG: DUF4214 domain-containing protein [Clostridiales bacterium]|nr:DUF4214 domain-containing protein [Clostridiales bacterium]